MTKSEGIGRLSKIDSTEDFGPDEKLIQQLVHT